MNQDSYKLDLEIEVQQMVLGKEVSYTATYDRVDLLQAYEIVNKILDQGCVLKSMIWR